MSRTKKLCSIAAVLCLLLMTGAWQTQTVTQGFQTLTTGSVLMEKGPRWSVLAAPSVGNGASIAKAAGGVGVRHVVDCISFSAEASTAPVATDVVLKVQDGAANLWYIAVGVPASTGTLVLHSVCGLNLIGTANTAMTIAMSPSIANVSQSVDMSGYDVQ